MTTTINASPSNGIVQTADGSGVMKLQSNGVTTNALAWVNFAGASGTRNASYNVSSVTRTNTGRYTVNFATTLSDANYVLNISDNQVSGADNVGFLGYYTPTTTAVSIVTANSAGAYVDAYAVSIAIFGN